MSLPNPSEFQSVDGFYEPVERGVMFSIPPVLIAGIVLLLLAALLLGWLMGRRGRPDADPSEAIYGAIKKAVSAAAGAPRDSVVITARHLKTVIEDRLGAVRRLGHGVHGPYAKLDDAIEGYGEADDPHKPDHDDHKQAEVVPLGAARKVTINARNFVLNTTRAGHDVEESPHAGAGDHAHGGHGEPHDDKHGDDHGGQGPDGGHRPRKRLDAKAQLAAIRTAVHDFSDYWSDKPARLKDLREARTQLTTRPPSSSGNQPWDPKPGH
ncbi:hypothetical protein BH10PSE1_BH10PSE1_20150 [soil metagenome]